MPLMNMLVPVLLAIAPPAASTQGAGSSSATVQIGGRIPATVSIAGANASAMTANFNTMVIGNGTLNNMAPINFKMRSNVPYRLTAKLSSISGNILDGLGGDGIALKTGDIGFGIVALNKAGTAVVGGTSSRTDNITAGFDVTGGWPTSTDGKTPPYQKTLRDLTSSDVQILTGERISASGDNSSSDNYMMLGIGMSVLPQYLSAGEFTGVLTLTLSPAGS